MKKLGVVVLVVLAAGGVAFAAHDPSAATACRDVTTGIGVVCVVGTPAPADLAELDTIHEQQVSEWTGR